MEEMPFPVEDNGKKEGDHHDRSTDDRDSPASNQHVEEDARKGQAGCPFFDREGEKEKFRSRQDPEQERVREERHDPEVIA